MEFVTTITGLIGVVAALISAWTSLTRARLDWRKHKAKTVASQLAEPAERVNRIQFPIDSIFFGTLAGVNTFMLDDYVKILQSNGWNPNFLSTEMLSTLMFRNGSAFVVFVLDTLIRCG